MSKEDAYVLGRIVGGDSRTLAYYISIYIIIFNRSIIESILAKKYKYF